MNIKGKYQLDSKDIRIYSKGNSCIFKKNNEEFGGLSNMATGFPLLINNIQIKTTEALYQACRFPHIPEIQKNIIEQRSPMNVKMISNANKKQSRPDWDNIRLKVMKWCITVKLAQNFIKFGAVIHETGLKNIVENSSKDNFWGAIPNEDGTIFTGQNALGRLLMDLRQRFYGKDVYSILYIAPPKIDNFLLHGKEIGVIDERMNFIKYLQDYWKVHEMNFYENNSIIEQNESTFYSKENLVNPEQINKERETPNKKKSKKKNTEIIKPSLFDNNL